MLLKKALLTFPDFVNYIPENNLLWHAIHYGSVLHNGGELAQIIQLLLDSGCHPHYPNLKNWSMQDLAKHMGQVHCGEEERIAIQKTYELV